MPRSTPPRAPRSRRSSATPRACTGTTPTGASTCGCAPASTRAASSTLRSRRGSRSCPATHSPRRVGAATPCASPTAPLRPTASPRGSAGCAARMTVSAVATSAATLADKVWERHVVRTGGGEPDLLYIDLHLVHEITSAQAFDGLRLAGRGVRRPDLTLATMDHNVPTDAQRPDD